MILHNILLTGSRGKLGTELKKHLNVTDFEGNFTMSVDTQDCDLIIHAGAYTKVQEAETWKDHCFQTNVYGTFNLVELYKNVPFVYISSEYARNPLGIYARTKAIAEEVVRQHPQHLIIRTLFKPNPFPFEYAYEDQYTQGDYLDVIAKLIADKIKSWNGKSEECYVGTGRKTMYELAKRTRPNVRPNKVTSPIIPKDYAPT